MGRRRRVCAGRRRDRQWQRPLTPDRVRLPLRWPSRIPPDIIRRTPHAHRSRATRRALWVAFALTAAFAAVEAVGGWLAGSLALISDAGHMVTDAASFVVALIAATVTARPPSQRASYGYARAEVIAAFVNALAMLALIVWIVVEAVLRLLDADAGGRADRDGGRRGGACRQPRRRLDAVAPRQRHQRPRRVAARLRRSARVGGGASSPARSSTGPAGCRSTRSCRSSSRC